MRPKTWYTHFRYTFVYLNKKTFFRLEYFLYVVSENGMKTMQPVLGPKPAKSRFDSQGLAPGVRQHLQNCRKGLMYIP